MNGKHGVFPSSYVEMIEESSDDPAPPPVPTSVPPSQSDKDKASAPGKRYRIETRPS